MDQSVLQRHSQLHQPQRRRSHHGQVSGAGGAALERRRRRLTCLCCVFALQPARDGLCVRHHRGSGHRPGPERTNEGIPSLQLITSSRRMWRWAGGRPEPAELASLLLARLRYQGPALPSAFCPVVVFVLTLQKRLLKAPASTTLILFTSSFLFYAFSELHAAHLTPDWTICSICCRGCC